jgi:hypothetical protein
MAQTRRRSGDLAVEEFDEEAEVEDADVATEAEDVRKRPAAQEDEAKTEIARETARY